MEVVSPHCVHLSDRESFGFEPRTCLTKKDKKSPSSTLFGAERIRVRIGGLYESQNFIILTSNIINLESINSKLK